MSTRDAAVLAAIPHREPFLFVDRILERGDDRIATEWHVPADAPFFRGHYPGQPIVPGVLICECAFQTGAILCTRRAEDANGDSTAGHRSHVHGAADPSRREAARDAVPEGAVPVLARIGDARFKRVVVPGETLRCEVLLEERVGPARYMKAKVTCGGELVLRVEFVVAVTAVGSEQSA